MRVVDVVLTESELRTGLDREALLKEVMEVYSHNLKAVEIGVTTGNSFLLGTVPRPSCVRWARGPYSRTCCWTRR